MRGALFFLRSADLGFEVSDFVLYKMCFLLADLRLIGVCSPEVPVF